MAELIKREFPLAVLMLSIERGGASDDRRSSADRLRCEVQVDGGSRGSSTYPAAEVGLPLTFEDAQRFHYREPAMRLPDGLSSWLDERLQDVREAGRPLWLQLDHPNGALPLVPWERLLGPLAPGGVLRMPYHLTRPETSQDALDIAMVVTSPDQERRFAVEELVIQHTREILAAISVETTIHVFADLASFEGLQRRWGAPTPPDPRIVLHDPSRAPSMREGTNEPVDSVEAWFPWIAKALEGQSVDVLHLVTHGYVGSNQGMLVMADAPENPRGDADADVIGARWLHTLSRTIGAWCTILTSPPTNYSVLGHRLLADALARQRPGPVGLHEARSDAAPGGLGETYRFLCGYTTQPPHRDDQVIYVHPARTGTPEQLAQSPFADDLQWETLPEEFSAASGATADLLRKGRGAPQWLASYQRGLEQVGSGLELRTRRYPAPAPGASDASDADDARSGSPSERGTAEALRFLSETVRAHSRGREPGGSAR